MKALLASLVLLAACGSGGTSPAPAPSPAPPVTEAQVVARLPGFLSTGWVVSRGQNENHGDSLLFTGLALASLSCADGAPEASALMAMVKGGTVYRYPGDPEQVSLDAYIGFYDGVAARTQRCPDEAPAWGAGLASLPDPGVPAGFDYVRRKLLAKLGAGAEPPASLQAELEAATFGWARATVAAHAACFRVNISLLALQTVEELGGTISPFGKAAFCWAAAGNGLATVDQWCGRGGLQNFLDHFIFDQYQYKHQNCSWQLPDGAGEGQPAIDYLVAYRQLNGG